jgi:uncharacterized protein YbjT (DUF2867 family)
MDGSVAMKVIVFGATGMVGQGVLRECLLAQDVERVLAVGRSPTGRRHEKLEELVVADLHALASHATALAGYDACFFCLGASSAGMDEKSYRRLTYDLTFSAASLLAQRNPGMTFVYVSGAGTDSTERGRVMWARVKGETENALLRLPFRAAYMFRPGFIQPLHDARSRTAWIGATYALLGPIFPLLDRLAPQSVTTTERLGLAMLEVARSGAATPVVETRGIDQLWRVASGRARAPRQAHPRS